MPSSQTISEFLRASTRQLIEAGISTARLDCLILTEDELGRDRSWLLANPESQIPEKSVRRLTANISRRTGHVPIAYIRGKSEFYGREFTVNAHTLVPRPETETMIDLIKTLPLASGARFLDVGTGSGCIAITAALELPNLRVTACDIDKKCILSAKKNARMLQAHVTFIQSDLLDSVDTCEIIGANLPYVPDEFQINTAATHEPRHAIYGGKDGLELYRKLFYQLSNSPRKPLSILTESLPFQHDKLEEIAKVAGFSLMKTDDFIQIFGSI